jgi:hypothetical protein
MKGKNVCLVMPFDLLPGDMIVGLDGHPIFLVLSRSHVLQKDVEIYPGGGCGHVLISYLHFTGKLVLNSIFCNFSPYTVLRNKH